MGLIDMTASSLRVRVPVLSEQRTSIPAASSTAERRVDRTPLLARDRAPTAAAKVNIDGKATGIDDRIATRRSGTISPIGMETENEYTPSKTGHGSVEQHKITHNSQYGFLLRALRCGSANEFRCP